MITICGGKWTTYRNMAEDCVNHAATLGRLPERACVTEHLRIHNSDMPALQQLSERLVVRAIREEMARTVEDVLARRTRALFLNARAAIAMAPRVAAIMARELGRDSAWQTAQVEAFEQTARCYLPQRSAVRPN
jgi:glycerol-3-phosphate dehydrogenase